MKFVFLTCGLPGPAYHGGAVTCWAIARAMLSRGHKVTVVSLFDTSELNPYLDSKDTQTKALAKIGAAVEFIDYNHRALTGTTGTLTLFSKAMRTVKNLLNPDIEVFFPWTKLFPQVEKKLKKIKPDAIFTYHFDALSSVSNARGESIMAGVGDLWHLPAYFRLNAGKPSLRKYLTHYPNYLLFKSISEKLMLEMLGPCKKRGAFAAHYAEWLRNKKGFEDTLYLRTPAHDPVGAKWKELRAENKTVDRPKILMIGDLATTSTSSGIREFAFETLPILEKELGENGFELHMVGGGSPSKEISKHLDRPSVKIRGRIIPPDTEFLSSDLILVPTPITLGIRVRIITAFSFGCPVVSHRANAAGIPELCHNDNALLSDSGRGLAEEVIRLLRDGELKTKLEATGRETFEKYFSEKVAAGRIVDEMEEMVLDQKEKTVNRRRS